VDTADFEAAVAQSINACAPGTVFLAAVSGGADSTAMLAALAAAPSIDLHCMHIEHGIRPAAESRGDAGFVRELCAAFNIPCRVASIPPGRIAQIAANKGVGIEAAARLYRYRALFREARRLAVNGNKPALIVTAHTRDDFLETALMRLLRGAGPAGLAAIPARRGRLLRPLLAVSRADVLAYLAARNIPWREDSTNRDTRFLRNRVRHCLVPRLDEAFPGWRTGLAAVSETQSLAAAFINDEAARRVRWSPGGSGLRTKAETFFAQPAIVREEALFAGIDRLLALKQRNAAHPVKRAAVRRFCAGQVSAVDLGPVRVRRRQAAVVISAAAGQKVSERGFSLLIKAPGFYNLKRVTIEVRAGAVGSTGGETPGAFCALLPLVLRPANTGDRIVRGGRKTAPGDAAKGRGRERMASAVDRRGTAAFIGTHGLLLAREFPEAAERVGEDFYLVKITESHNKGVVTDVQ
jgi:tRNA(Ile)-lysidine synthase